ncbi:hypothetical protein IOCL2690_000708900 [Leishmania lindenbergi]|uniref:Uncharacterized protein n=1 Tax=Leishmania lindenbergi TaxID=651832 RepID=A0AAW2ZX06_9TRYP
MCVPPVQLQARKGCDVPAYLTPKRYVGVLATWKSSPHHIRLLPSANKNARSSSPQGLIGKLGYARDSKWDASCVMLLKGLSGVGSSCCEERHNVFREKREDVTLRVPGAPDKKRFSFAVDLAKPYAIYCPFSPTACRISLRHRALLRLLPSLHKPRFAGVGKQQNVHEGYSHRCHRNCIPPGMSTAYAPELFCDVLK